MPANTPEAWPDKVISHTGQASVSDKIAERVTDISQVGGGII